MSFFISVFRVSTVLFALLFSLSGYAQSSLDPKAVKEFSDSINDEYSYRQSVEPHAAKWAEELMFMYKWSAKYPTNWHGGRDRTLDDGDVSRRLHSEFAWILMTGYGAVATFDFAHADTTLIGSTSRLTSTLLNSKSFWTEVRKQCIEIRDYYMTRSSGDAKTRVQGHDIRSCADRLRSHLTISQIAGSNVSLFVGGGVAIGLGKRLFKRYASEWVASRVLPALPAFARTRWFAAGLTATIVVVPAGFIMASAVEEKKQNEAFLEDLPAAISENKDAEERTSVLKTKALRTEREVLEFTAWLKPLVPGASEQPMGEDASRRFMIQVKLSGPNYGVLVSKRAELETRRAALEAELAAVPGVTEKLRSLVELRQHGALAPKDAELFRSAQYLAALRLTLKFL